MKDARKALGYLESAAALGFGWHADFTGDAVVEVAYYEIAHGTLEVGTCSRLFKATGAASEPVPVLVGLALTHDTGEPTLMLPATLMRNGTLRPQAADAAWVELDRLERDPVRNLVTCVSDLDDYRAHQSSMRTLPRALTWPETLARAFALFEALCPEESRVDEAGVDPFDLTRCLVRPYRHADAGVLAARQLSAMEALLEVRGAESLPAAARQLLGLADPEEQERFWGEGLTDEGLLSHKLVCGVLPGVSGLTDHDHAMLAALSERRREPIAEVDAPTGTAQERVALNAVANMVVEAALRGDDLPQVLVVGPTDVVVGAISGLEPTTRAPQSSLALRWLPRIAQISESGARRVLGPLPQLLRLDATDATPAVSAPWALRLDALAPESSELAPYGEPFYLPQAQTYYLDCVSGFLRLRTRDAIEAKSRLSERLRLVDQLRCELVDAYFEVCRADDHLRRRDQLLDHQGELRRAHSAYRARLEHWEQVWRRHPQPLARIGALRVDQRSLIAKSAQPDESLALDKATVAEVVEAYRDALMRIEDEIDRLRATSNHIMRLVSAAEPQGERCQYLVGRLQDLCRLDADQAALLDTLCDGTRVSLERLDAVLDATVRTSEFWLAVHAFEADWLITTRRSQQAGQAMGWAGWSHLLPIPFATLDSAPAVLSTWGLMAGTGRTGTETGQARRLDQLIVLSAQRVNPALGCALVGCAERALVFGSPDELGPGAIVGTTFDALLRRRGGVAADDADLIALDGTRSLLDLVRSRLAGDTLPLTDDAESSDTLAAFRCRLADRIAVSSAPERPVALERRASRVLAEVRPLSYVLVPDSSFEPAGSSHTNEAQALALMRWLKRHGSDLVRATSGSLAIVTTTRAQAALVRSKIGHAFSLAHAADVVALADCAERRWSCVIWDTVLGPETLRTMSPDGLRRAMGSVAACATDAVVAFCGPAWTRATDGSVLDFMREATCIGRLFSCERERAKVVEQRVKPLSLTQMLSRLEERGDLERTPDAAAVNRALRDAGLIERVKAGKGTSGWKPTPSGVEVGIVATTDAKGTPFCLYEASAEAVVARVVAGIAT